MSGNPPASFTCSDRSPRFRFSLPRRMRRPPSTSTLRLAALLLAGAAACAPTDEVALGPVDGHDLPAADTGRVAVGDPAPDFALRDRDGQVVRLSDYQGSRDVILVFYRGHW